MIKIFLRLSFLFLSILSSFGIRKFQIVRSIYDQNQENFDFIRKRSTDQTISQRTLIVQLEQKNLTLILKNSKRFFTDEAKIDFQSKTSRIDRSNFYEGFLQENPENSWVFGFFHFDSFDGIVENRNELWSIEPLRRYKTTDKQNRQTIIYKLSDLDFDEKIFSRGKRSNEPRKQKFFEKRNSMWKTDRICCSLDVRVDPTLWELIFRNEGNQKKAMTVRSLINLVARTVQSTNQIYRSKFQNFQLRIKRIRILTPEDCLRKNLTLSEQNLCRPRLDSYSLLKSHSIENLNEFCLSYLFTARNFDDGTLGLAWIATNSTSSRGGICESPTRDFFQGKRVIKTLNTGLISFIHHNTRISQLMAELALAHEIGHSLGAEHDNENCSQNDPNGRFLMFRKATNGLEPNNNLFSNCSLENMGPLLYSVLHQTTGRINCLTDCSESEICGNRLVDENEECDCGSTSQCEDICCFPSDYFNSSLACRLREDAECSPSNGDCCSENCHLYSSTRICYSGRDGENCLNDVRCDGIQSTCPIDEPKYFRETNTFCQDRTALCDRGKCNKSICSLIGKVECLLDDQTESIDSDRVDKDNSCHIACFDQEQQACVDTSRLKMLNNQSSTGFGFKHQTGHRCAGTNGFCDDFGKCQLLNQQTFSNKFFNEQNLDTIRYIIQNYWWALVLFILGFLGFVSIFIGLGFLRRKLTNHRSTFPNETNSNRYSSTNIESADGKLNFASRKLSFLASISTRTQSRFPSVFLVKYFS